MSAGGPRAAGSSHRPAAAALLRRVQQRFYPGADRATQQRFYRDRRHLLHALSWPATWLEQRALTCSPARYQALLLARLDAIATHGDPTRYSAYFPAYLLKCLQDWFQHHGDELDLELKHIRNALDRVLASATITAEVRRDAQHLAVLVSAHRLLAGRRSAPVRPNAHQLSLPLQ